MSSVAPRERVSRQWPRYGALLVLFLFLVGAFAASYTAGTLLLLAVAAVLLLAAGIRRWGRRRFLVAGVVGLILIACASAASLFFFATAPHEFLMAIHPLACDVRIEPAQSSTGTFRVAEEGSLSCSQSGECAVSGGSSQPDASVRFIWPESEAVASSRGLLVREVNIHLEGSRSGDASVQLPDGVSLKAPDANYTCGNTTVSLPDFPRSSFYAAKGADAKLYPYLDVETVTWSNADSQDITFAYVPSPFYHLRPILGPFVGVTSLPQFLIVLVGLIAGVIFTPVVKPVLTDIFQDKLKGRLRKLDVRTSEPAGAQSMSGDDAASSILFLPAEATAEATDESRFKLGEESRAIEEELRRSKQADRYRFDQRWPIRAEDLSKVLLEAKPQFVHFSGYGTRAAELRLSDASGASHPIPPEALEALFELLADHVQCVVMNACYTEVQASAIARYIPYVIGTSRAIGDEAALSFAIGFYQALGEGRQVEEAYRFGCAQIKLQGLPGNAAPVLIKKDRA